MKRSLLILVVSILTSSAAAHAGQCINWHAAMAAGEMAHESGKSSVFVQSFENFTKHKFDDWLATGLRDYIKDLLSTSDARVSTVAAAASLQPASGDRYQIGGSYQRLGDKLRIFIALSDDAGGLKKQYEVFISYPNNKEFFTRISDAAEDMMKIMSAGFDKKALSAVRDATESTEAYESYSKGRALLSTYDPKNFDAAKESFSDAKRIDFRSPLGYEGLAELYAFEGFFNRQSGISSSHYFQKAEAELVSMSRLARPAPLLMTRKKDKVQKKESPSEVKMQNRFVLNNVSYQEGVLAMQAGLTKQAIAAFKKAVEIVPEDAMSWYYLSQTEARENNAKGAQEAMDKAVAINPCLAR